MLLKACLNGARRPGRHPALPVTPAQLAADAAAVASAGAGAVHLHVKDAHGADTLDGAALGAVLEAVRTAVPGVPVGATTGAWAAPDPADRLEAVAAWTALPDFASVNWHEPGAEDVAALLLDRGVGVEAGLWHVEAAERWRRWPDRDRCLRVLLELPDGPDEAGTADTGDALLTSVGAGPGGRTGGGVPVLLHGAGSSAWPAVRHAGRRGVATRIGLEDTLELPDGSPAPDNAALVRAARAVLPGPVR